MYEVLIDILDAIRAQGELDAIELGRILNRHNKRAATRERADSKKRVLPYISSSRRRIRLPGRRSASTMGSSVSSSPRFA